MPTLDDPVAFSFGPVEVRWYAVLILAGIAAAIVLIRWLAARRGLDPEFVLDMAPWVVFAAIVGARLYYVVLKADYFAANPDEALNIRLGGLTIHGALIAGLVTVYLFCRLRGERFFTWIDLLVPGVALGQAVGRWGNWANQEAFGTPTDLPWAVTIDPARRPAGYEAFATFHPTFLYESIFNLANAAFLSWLALRLPGTGWLRTGDVAWIYFILYGVGRLTIERIRTDSVYLGSLPAAYWLSFALIGFGLAMLVLRRMLWVDTGDHPEPGEAGRLGYN